MHYLYASVRFFPYWALPLVLILVEVGIHMRRRQRTAQYYYLASAGVLLLLTLLWFIFRGDVNSDDWVRWLTGGV